MKRHATSDVRTFLLDDRPDAEVLRIIRYIEESAIPALLRIGFDEANAARIAWEAVRARLNGDIKVVRSGRHATIRAYGRTYRIEERS